MAWQSVGQHIFLPTDKAVQVGEFDLAAGQDTIWVKITQINNPGDWPWSYGILSWRNANGTPLGSIKAYSNRLGEVFRLGVGLPPSDGTGSIWFEPRGYNLAWLKAGFPWELSFEAQSGSTGKMMEGFWNRDADNGVLTPKFGNDTVKTGDTQLDGIKVSAGFPSGSQGPGAYLQFNGGVYSYRALGSNVPVFQGGEAPVAGQSGNAIQLWSQGDADFAGRVTASNVTFRLSDPIHWSISRSGESTYNGPELDLLKEIERLEALVFDLYDQLQLPAPMGRAFWT